MNVNYSCGIAAAKCYFGEKVVNEGNYTLIPNAIEVEKFVFNKEVRDRIRKEYHLDGLHVVGHVGRFMAQKNHVFILKVFAELAKADNQAHLVLLGDGELLEAAKQKVIDLGLPKGKMVLYISSFTQVGLKKREIRRLRKILGQGYIDRIPRGLRSRKRTLEWLDKLLELNEDCYVVYRPHPGENIDEELKKRIKEGRFFIIQDYSVIQWILIADKVYTWI